MPSSSVVTACNWPLIGGFDLVTTSGVKPELATVNERVEDAPTLSDPNLICVVETSNETGKLAEPLSLIVAFPPLHRLRASWNRSGDGYWSPQPWCPHAAYALARPLALARS